MDEQQNVIEMANIVKDFNGFKANNGINLELKKGEIEDLNLPGKWCWKIHLNEYFIWPS